MTIQDDYFTKKNGSDAEEVKQEQTTTRTVVDHSQLSFAADIDSGDENEETEGEEEEIDDDN